MNDSTSPQLHATPCVVGGWLALTPVVASQPAATASVGVEIALAAVLIAGLLVAIWWVWQFYGRQEDALDAPRHAPTEGPFVDPDITGSPRPAMPEGGRLRPSTKQGEMAPEKLFFSSDSELPERRCPECERTFPGVFEVCPFDTTRLELNASAESTAEGARLLPRRVCRQCDRRYELTARYCYHDGRELEHDRDRRDRDLPSFRICRNCGWESKATDSSQCDCSTPSIAVLDPSKRGRITPAFPFNRCRQCGYIASPDQIECPVDGALLLPELSAQLTVLPPTGHGTRRRICTECGAQFGGQCSYCAYDATPLVDIN